MLIIEGLLTFQRKPRCREKSRQAGRRSARRRTQGMAFPCQVFQQRMARFPAQPAGPGPFCRDAAFLAGSFSPLNFAARALPRGKTGSGAVVLKRQQTLVSRLSIKMLFVESREPP
ncbi:hypothetical protein DNK34_24845 [Pseudomonas dryadis]|uniref:Uncharacterized protein n=1 Tax=Phytopseudomonas dryadis TaxID=2487520 RepID=A0ABY1Z2Q6_9GAMM|nr:hypothetical protein DNK34_24845 [Pseudomonas dryadis]TBV12120.1 hypothetical protein DNK41_24905 [Pseudomonas sp. FRB 230]